MRNSKKNQDKNWIWDRKIIKRSIKEEQNSEEEYMQQDKFETKEITETLKVKKRMKSKDTTELFLKFC